MGFDIRLPLGILFSLVGALLVLQGLVAGPSTAPGSTGEPVNLVWGTVVLAFGLVCLRLARRKRA